MNELTLKDFRCFHEKQSARLSPLTLLVGENSTGKTSFMALLKAMWDMIYSIRVPDFKESPYDLGSFDEIVHHRVGRAESFVAGFSINGRRDTQHQLFKYEASFEKKGTVPVPVRRYRTLGETWIEETYTEGEPYIALVGTVNGSWRGSLPGDTFDWSGIYGYGDRMWPPGMAERLFSGVIDDREIFRAEPMQGSPSLGQEDLKSLGSLSSVGYDYFDREARVFASAPVRSKPKRTYDPSRPTPDPEGDYIPMYLGNLISRDEERWGSLQRLLEQYGKRARVI